MGLSSPAAIAPKCLQDAGANINEVLVGAGFNGEPLSRQTVDTWTNTYDISVNSLYALDGETRSQLTDREWTYVVDTSNMQIVWKGFGSFSGQAPTDSGAYLGLERLNMLLGTNCM